MDEESVRDISTGILFNLEKEKLPFGTTWIDLEDITVTGISQILFYLIYMWNPKQPHL